MADIPNNASTNATLTVGGSFQSSLEFTGDRDWVRIDLAPGQWVAVTQRGTGETPLDAYLSVYDADGNFVTSDDESNASNTDFDATVIFGGGEGRTFYIEAGSYFNGSRGSYTLEAASIPEPSGSPIEVLNSGWSRSDTATPITVFFVPEGQERDGVTSEGWSTSEREQFMAALLSIEAVADITFLETSNASSDFQLVRDTNELNNDGLLGYFYLPFQSTPSVGVFNGNGFGWTTDGLQAGGLGFSTIIHEALHGLGLAHAHADAPSEPAFPAVDVEFYDFGANGLNQGVYTIMSYNGGWGGAPITSNNFGESAGPMALDIAVLQELYGANTTYNNDNNTYELADANAAGTGWLSIWDTGGVDTITYSGTRDTVIDLRPATLDYGPGGGGFISNASGIQGGFTIANGAEIENAIGGSGDDTLIGNGLNNMLDGNAGNDTVESSSGSNMIYGSSGNDQITGGTDADSIYGGSGNDRIEGGGGSDALFGGRGNDTIQGGGGSDNITGGLGQDTMTGGTGADVFIFNAISASWDNNRDVIKDFQVGTDDIDLSIIDANLALASDQAFTFTAGVEPTNTAGAVWTTEAGGDTFIFVDRDGDGADMGIILEGVTGITASDFIL